MICCFIDIAHMTYLSSVGKFFKGTLKINKYTHNCMCNPHQPQVLVQLCTAEVSYGWIEAKEFMWFSSALIGLLWKL